MTFEGDLSTVEGEFGVLDGLVRALRRFSRACWIEGSDLVVSTCSIRRFFGLNTGDGWMVGSIGSGIFAFWCSTMREWGALLIVVFVGNALALISLGVIMPRCTCFAAVKWLCAAVSFLIFARVLTALAGAFAAGSRRYSLARPFPFYTLEPFGSDIVGMFFLKPLGTLTPRSSTC